MKVNPVMADLATNFMGLKIRMPILVAASTISASVDRVRQAQDAGAGAIVLRSLFEEQIRMDPDGLAAMLDQSEGVVNRRAKPSPRVVPGGPDNYLEWIERIREELTIPLIGSVNASSSGTWVEYARQMQDTGLDALELNIYRVPVDASETAAEIEDEAVRIVERVRHAVQIPLAVKLSPFYTAPANLAVRLVEAGASGLVLFNRFLQPDIDTDIEQSVSELEFSTPAEIKLPLRWTALLHRQVDADIALTTGVHSGLDVVKAILAGAQVVQVASALYLHGIGHLRDLETELTDWMEGKGYADLEAFRGLLSRAANPESSALERAHYIRLLMAQT